MYLNLDLLYIIFERFNTTLFYDNLKFSCDYRNTRNNNTNWDEIKTSITKQEKCYLDASYLELYSTIIENKSDYWTDQLKSRDIIQKVPDWFIKSISEKGNLTPKYNNTVSKNGEYKYPVLNYYWTVYNKLIDNKFYFDLDLRLTVTELYLKLPENMIPEKLEIYANGGFLFTSFPIKTWNKNVFKFEMCNLFSSRLNDIKAILQIKNGFKFTNFCTCKYTLEYVLKV